MNDHKRIQEFRENRSSEKYVKYDLASGQMSENGGTTWVTKLKLGTPAQIVSMMLDTGTLNTWVTAESCTTEACQAHISFNPNQSSTFSVDDKAPKIENFGPWGDMGVAFGKDICHLRSPSMNKDTEEIHLMLATSYTGDSFKQLVSDGGLAIPAVPDDEATALLNTLYQQGIIETPLASFYLDKIRGYGECRMGALNYDHFHPETLNFLPLVTPNGGESLAYLWAVKLDCLTVDGKSVFDQASETQLVLDTGSSFFKGNACIINTLIDQVTRGGTLPTRVASKTLLENYPTMKITLGGVAYTLSPEQYFVKMNNKWVLGIQVLDGMPENMLLVGQVFLETVYSIFDFGREGTTNRAVLLAEPINKPLSVVGTWQNQYGSTLVVDNISPQGTFQGSYSSDTGATGKYPVMGVADPDPDTCQTVSFSVTWKSEVGAQDPSWHFVSGFTGALTLEGSEEVLQVTMLLQRGISSDVPAYEATSTSSLTFKRI